MSEVQYWQVIVQVITAIVAIVAFLLSFFNFYWSNLRQRKALFFVRVLTPSTFLNQPQFALVNGSNRDVLITGIHCCFLDKDGKGSAYPEQTLIASNGSEMRMLLEPGEAFQYWIKLPAKFETGFHLQGEYGFYPDSPDTSIKPIMGQEVCHGNTQEVLSGVQARGC